MDAITESTMTVIALIARKPGTTFEEFRSYYENHHVPLVVELLMQGDARPLTYTRQYINGVVDGHSESSFPLGGAEDWQYDCFSRSVFRDMKHRDAFIAEFVKHKETILQDEAKFLDGSKLKVVYVTESLSNIRKD